MQSRGCLRPSALEQCKSSLRLAEPLADAEMMLTLCVRYRVLPLHCRLQGTRKQRADKGKGLAKQANAAYRPRRATVQQTRQPTYRSPRQERYVFWPSSPIHVGLNCIPEEPNWRMASWAEKAPFKTQEGGDSGCRSPAAGAAAAHYRI